MGGSVVVGASVAGGGGAVVVGAAVVGGSVATVSAAVVAGAMSGVVAAWSVGSVVSSGDGRLSRAVGAAGRRRRGRARRQGQHHQQPGQCGSAARDLPNDHPDEATSGSRRPAGASAIRSSPPNGSSNQIVRPCLTPRRSGAVSCGWVTSDGHASSAPDRHRRVVDALTGEPQLGAVVIGIELHGRRHLGDVVVSAQRLLLARCVADDEGVAQTVVVDERPHLLQLRPDPDAEVVLDGAVQHRADRRQRDLPPGHRVVGVGGEPDDLGGPRDRPAELRRPERHDEQVLAQFVDAHAVVDRIAVAEHALQVVDLGAHDQDRCSSARATGARPTAATASRSKPGSRSLAAVTVPSARARVTQRGHGAR